MDIKKAFKTSDSNMDEEIINDPTLAGQFFLQVGKKKQVKVDAEDSKQVEEVKQDGQKNKNQIKDIREIGKKQPQQFRNWDTTINTNVNAEVDKKITEYEEIQNEEQKKKKDQEDKKVKTFADKVKQKRLESQKFGQEVQVVAEEFPDLNDKDQPKKKVEKKKKTDTTKESSLKPKFINSKNQAINNNKPLINILTDEDPNVMPKAKIQKDDNYDNIQKLPKDEKDKIKFHDGAVQFTSHKQKTDLSKPLDMKDEQAKKQKEAELRAEAKQKQLLEQLEKTNQPSMKDKKNIRAEEKTEEKKEEKKDDNKVENKEEKKDEEKSKPFKFVNKKLKENQWATDLRTNKDGKTAKEIYDEKQKFLAEKEMQKQIEKKAKNLQENKTTNEFEIVLDKSTKSQLKKIQKGHKDHKDHKDYKNFHKQNKNDEKQGEQKGDEKEEQQTQEIIEGETKKEQVIIERKEEKKEDKKEEKKEQAQNQQKKGVKLMSWD